MVSEFMLLCDPEPEAHILAKPLDIVSSPAIVEKVEVEAFCEVGLVSRKVYGQLLAQSDNRRIQCLNAESAFGSFVAQPAKDRVHRAVASGYDIKRRNGTARLVEQPTARIAGQRLEAEPKRFGHAVRGLSKPGKANLDGGFGVRQRQFEVHRLRPCNRARFFRFGVVDL